jgi:hypothetical protein
MGRTKVRVLFIATTFLALVAVWGIARGFRPQRGAVGPVAAGPLPSEAEEVPPQHPVVDPVERTAVPEARVTPTIGEANLAPASTVPSRWMRARIVDEHGSPLAGASMSFVDAHLATTSGPDGTAALAVPLDRLVETSIVLDFTAQGRTTEQRWIDLRPEGDGHAGEVALLPAGSVFGRVVDESGAPLALFVGVFSPVPTLSEQDRESVAAQGAGLVPRGSGTRSKQDGSFRIDAVPVGSCIVAARRPGSFYVWTEPLAVQAGQVVDAGTLVLRAPSPDQCIEGKVLDVEGKPTGSRTVQLWKPGKARNVNHQLQSVSTDAEGRFRFAVARNTVVHVILLDEAQQEEIARVADVAPGGPQIVLRVPPWRTMELVVRSAKGEPVEDVRFNLCDADGIVLFGNRARTQSVQPGVWTLELPARPFRLWARATGYDPQSTELLDPATAPQRIELVLLLDHAAVIRCLVRRHGEPVADAQVRAYPLLEGPHRLGTGFSTRLAEQPVASASVSGEPGVCELRVKHTGAIVLLILLQGRVVLEQGPIVVGPDEPDRELELALPEPCGLEGRVLLAEGRDPAGILIGASRGDGEVRALTLGDSADFRLEGLAPGQWQVRQIDEMNNPHLLSDRRAHSDHRDSTWDVVLVPGQTARCEIDLRDEALCRIRGRVQLTPDGPSAWQFGLRNRFGQVSPDGTFQADTFEPGSAYLTLWGDYGPSRRLMISEQLDLAAGEATWALDLLTAELELRGVPAFQEDARGQEPELLRLQWTDSSNRQGTFRVLSHAGGPLVLRGLPPGAWTIETRYSEDGAPDREWRRRDSKIDLAPGDHQLIEL